MTFEKKLIVATAVMVLLALGSCIAFMNAIDRQYEGCRGLESVVDKIWTGKDCVVEEPE